MRAIEYLRAIIWPRQGEDIPPATGGHGKPIYRYAIVGLILTDTPIDGLEGNQYFVDGQSFGIADMIAKGTETDISLGNANTVLTGLDEIPKMIKLGEVEKTLEKLLDKEKESEK
jgi:hypothetical protein